MLSRTCIESNTDSKYIYYTFVGKCLIVIQRFTKNRAQVFDYRHTLEITGIKLYLTVEMKHFIWP